MSKVSKKRERKPYITTEGKKIVSPDMFREREVPSYCGIGDDIENGITWAGTPFLIQSSGIQTYVTEWQFKDSSRLAGGGYRIENGDCGDYINFDIYAPATASISNQGAGLFNKVPVGGGANLYVPSGGSGDWDIDLEETLNSNVTFTKAVPVTSLNKTGFFDYDIENDLLTINYLGKGAYNLFDVPITVAKYMVNYYVGGTQLQDMTIAGVTPKLILPHWKFKIEFVSTTTANKCFSWWIFIAREG